MNISYFIIFIFSLFSISCVASEVERKKMIENISIDMDYYEKKESDTETKEATAHDLGIEIYRLSKLPMDFKNFDELLSLIYRADRIIDHAKLHKIIADDVFDENNFYLRKVENYINSLQFKIPKKSKTLCD